MPDTSGPKVVSHSAWVLGSNSGSSARALHSINL